MRLIDADELQEAIEALSYHADKFVVDEEKHGFCTGIAVAVRQTELIPTIEAEPKHGWWINSRWKGAWHSCSVCGGIPLLNTKGQDVLSAYCPNCGARMDGGENGI